ncbi:MULTISPECIES: aminotransferase-like domain-containing protein [Actibacterium]|uniref:GntR family transcriptional regulator/MocR family aminotransferase n=1 Tax=Actibacterium naphthalenivorans TaxID=1614693 RepID=A0A840C7W0_9RHOB|nr:MULTISPECIES: PLP-dependent aminotransferase family protein [Actibacterium]ALG89422.1 GntR family transcriptional regulator [Actibacterium sp. EMB200-NS6]MBB4020953.1 GntR family transcriptional regulator/MocR family aminotransferase [Actibacterium naphthalenivorans]
MLERIFETPFRADQTLQQQIQERLIEAILAGKVSPYDPLPATRVLSEQIGVSRNTVMLVYERLAQDGYIRTVNRRGYFVDESVLRDKLNVDVGGLVRPGEPVEAVDFTAHMTGRYSRQPNIVKRGDWKGYAYPFIYGQVAADETSIARWRDCVRMAGTRRHAHAWVGDLVDGDDPMLIEQIQRRMLPHRGFRAGPEELLVTVGAQNALFLAGGLFCRPGAQVHLEDPCYVDARNIFAAQGGQLVPHAVDSNGMRMGDFSGAALVYVTPGHQAPTNVTMSMERRLALLEAARRDDFLIIEDDYEHELNFIGAQHPTLKSLDVSGRVIHIGSLTKPLFPGLRLGFVAAAAPVIRELRALRRLMYRHPSALAQRAMALFLAEGHYDTHIRRHRKELAARWKLMMRELDRQLPDCAVTMTTGGSGIWLALPEGVSARAVQRRAEQQGLLVEAGDVHYHGTNAPKNRLRLGFGAIEARKIAEGITLLGQVIAQERAQPPR